MYKRTEEEKKLVEYVEEMEDLSDSMHANAWENIYLTRYMDNFKMTDAELQELIEECNLDYYNHYKYYFRKYFELIKKCQDIKREIGDAQKQNNGEKKINEIEEMKRNGIKVVTQREYNKLMEIANRTPVSSGTFMELYNMVKKGKITYVVDDDGELINFTVDTPTTIEDSVMEVIFNRRYTNKPVKAWLLIIRDMINADIDLMDKEIYKSYKRNPCPSDTDPCFSLYFDFIDGFACERLDLTTTPLDVFSTFKSGEDEVAYDWYVQDGYHIPHTPANIIKPLTTTKTTNIDIDEDKIDSELVEKLKDLFGICEDCKETQETNTEEVNDDEVLGKIRDCFGALLDEDTDECDSDNDCEDTDESNDEDTDTDDTDDENNNVDNNEMDFCGIDPETWHEQYLELMKVLEAMEKENNMTETNPKSAETEK